MIVVDNLSKSYGQRKVLNDISFHISKGERVGLIGLNGAGKTTLLNILLGKTLPDSGLVRVFGQNNMSFGRDALKKIGYASGTEFRLQRNLKIQYSLENCAAMYDVPADVYNARLTELCNNLGIDEFLHSEPHQLSWGQRMKCELALAVLPQPELLILDEATIGIDTSAKETILQYIDAMQTKNETTIIYSGHYLNEIERLCGRIIMLYDKAVLYDGSTREFTSKYGSYRTMRLKCDSLPDIEDLPVEKYCIECGETVITFDKSKITAAEIIRHIRQKCGIMEIKLVEPNLEDTIKKIYTKERIGKND